MIAARLAAVGIALSASDIDHLAAAYPALLDWERMVQAMLRPDTEPALIFRAQPDE
ncbi:MAG: hypothetical protein AB7V27_01680 [Candidatus Binatia bacterium]